MLKKGMTDQFDCGSYLGTRVRQALVSALRRCRFRLYRFDIRCGDLEEMRSLNLLKTRTRWFH